MKKASTNKINIVYKLYCGIKSASLIPTFSISLFVILQIPFASQSIGCDCVEEDSARNLIVSNQVQGIGFNGQEKQYSKVSFQRISWAANCLTPTALIPAIISILSQEAALVSVGVNTGVTILATIGGFFEPTKDMRRIALKMGITATMVGATVASTYAWATFPVSLQPIVNGTLVPIDPVADLHFTEGYVTNVAFTSMAAAMSIANLALPCCRNFSVR